MTPPAGLRAGRRAARPLAVFEAAPSSCARRSSRPRFRTTPSRRVVLLIDDPPKPSGPAAAAALRRTRSWSPNSPTSLPLPPTLRSVPRRLRGAPAGCRVGSRPASRTASASRNARVWCRCTERWQAGSTVRRSCTRLRITPRRAVRGDHVPAPGVAVSADCAAARGTRGLATWDELATLHRQLAEIFRVEFASFERKRYANLSDARTRR